jgi:hypothetical protein
MKKKTAHRTSRAHHAPHFYVLFAFVMIVVGAFAAIVVTKVIGQTANNAIYACSQKQTGNLRMVAAGSVCRPDEVGVSWNVQGPAGPAGSSGTSSSTGLPFSCYECNLVPFASTFKGKDFSNAQINSSEFIGSDLTGVIFKGGFLTFDDFNNTNLTGADFSNVKDSGNSLGNISGLLFTNANLTNANFSNSQFSSCNFTGANLQNTNFANTTLSSVNFTGAQNMSSASMTGVIWNYVTCPDGTNSSDHSNTCVGHF